MKYSFGKTSKSRLATCEEDIQKVLNLAIERTPIDFGIAEGHRPIERQQKLYAQGRTEPGQIVTQIDGLKKKGKHNYYPSRGVDIYAFIDGKAVWEEVPLAVISGVILSCAKELGIAWEWGGFWKSFKDYPHHQINLTSSTDPGQLPSDPRE